MLVSCSRTPAETLVLPECDTLAPPLQLFLVFLLLILLQSYVQHFLSFIFTLPATAAGMADVHPCGRPSHLAATSQPLTCNCQPPAVHGFFVQHSLLLLAKP